MSRIEEVYKKLFDPRSWHKELGEEASVKLASQLAGFWPLLGKVKIVKRWLDSVEGDECSISEFKFYPVIPSQVRLERAEKEAVSHVFRESGRDLFSGRLLNLLTKYASLEIPESECILLEDNVSFSRHAQLDGEWLGDYSFEWEILAIKLDCFWKLHDIMRLNLIMDVVEDASNYVPEIYRYVFPYSSLKVKDGVEFDFYLPETEVYLLAYRHGVTEYASNMGFRVIDQRKQRRSVDSSLDKYVKSLKEKTGDDPIKKWAHRMLRASAWKETYDTVEDNFAEGLKAFTGSPLIAAKELFAGARCKKRLGFHDSNGPLPLHPVHPYPEYYSARGNVLALDSRYVVVCD
jgi:hypothetical protein